MILTRAWRVWALIAGSCFAVEAATDGDSVEVVVKGPPPKTLKGDVVRENLKGLVLQVDGAPVSLRWTEIESADGQPAAEVVKKLKEKLKDTLCPDCKGGLVGVLCPECLGTGEAPRLTRPCEKCKGTGTNGVPCKAKNCDDGKVPCTANCLKKGGPHLFLWKAPDGSLRAQGYTDNHLGEAFEYREVRPFMAAPGCAKCKGQGKSACSDCTKVAVYTETEPKSLGRCKVCINPRPGPGWLACPNCLGLGGLPCDTCLGAKAVPDPASATKCPYCKGGNYRCVTCQETGLVDPKAPARTSNYVDWAAVWTGEVRKALALLGEHSLSRTDRISFRSGRSLEGKVLHKWPAGLVLGIPADANGDIKVLAVLNRHVFRVEAAKGSPAAPATGPSPTPADPKPAPPPAAADTVVLKDGTSVTGKIVGKSETLVVVQTPDGKFVKIDAEKVAEIRTAPKAPK